jgi:Fibronectin type III domain
VRRTGPGAPTGLTARAGDAQVTLSWAAPASNAGPQVTGYNVYDGATADFKASTRVKSSTSTGATVTGLANGTTYYFWVTAVNIAGHESPSSAEVSARPETAAKVKLTSGSVPKELIAALAAIATVAVAGALTLAMRGRRLNSRSPRHVTPASDVRAVPGPRLPDAVNVRETGREPTRTVRFEPDRGTTITTIKEKP